MDYNPFVRIIFTFLSYVLDTKEFCICSKKLINCSRTKHSVSLIHSNQEVMLWLPAILNLREILSTQDRQPLLVACFASWFIILFAGAFDFSYKSQSPATSISVPIECWHFSFWFQQPANPSFGGSEDTAQKEAILAQRERALLEVCSNPESYPLSFH